MRNTSWIAATLKSGVALSALLSSTLISSANETELDEIIVIANRTETEAGKVGSTTHVVTEEDLKNDGAMFVSEYLTKLPGISFSQNGGAGKTSALRIRGMSGYYTKILLDGVDIADPSGTQVEARLEHVLLDDVERIEILKGSHSALYGGQAVGGVINIITKRAAPGTVKHNSAIEGGSYGTVNAAYGFQAATETADIAVNVQRYHTDGFSAQTPKSDTADEDGYENLTFSAKGSVDVTEALNLYFVARGTDGHSEFDGYNNPDARNEQDYRQYIGKLGANFAWLDDRMTTDASFQLVDTTRKYYGDNPGTYKGDRYKFDVLNTFDVTDEITLNFGGDWMHEDYAEYGSSRIFGGFVEAMVDPSDELSLSLSSRLDHHSRFGTYWSGRATTSYQIIEGTRFRSSIGNGFRAPALNELFGKWGPNPDLKPETSVSFDAGVDQEFFDGKLRFGATYFHILTEDLIKYRVNQYVQINGMSRSQGAELSANWDVLDNLSFNAAYTYTWAVGPDKKRLVRVPLHDVNVGATYKPVDVLTLNLNTSYVSGIEDDGELDDFVLVNAKAAYQYTENLTFHVRGENLLDQDYERIKDYQTPGLSVYAGLTASF
ncbi:MULTISPECIES: TonB-dependent receptor [unclassified Pseudovibrio]|uniref:TonB-dependent receptor plug domain-containing protein n=1 Tax=unclassified Pseudovibrio TaxID=2627060 RepID=UPI0007AE3B5F|nr:MULTISPECIES: TonB-dependent receptor [unclassified Pseudovibrio]KZL02521.1 Vitamin B12 transporter BtuB precursor [Pseudovibrio sp. W74]KZL07936.1 Vitamin B12 transporter BtuB precursor [Pseudovibrio sp. Ad14]